MIDFCRGTTSTDAAHAWEPVLFQGHHCVAWRCLRCGAVKDERDNPEGSGRFDRR